MSMPLWMRGLHRRFGFLGLAFRAIGSSAGAGRAGLRGAGNTGSSVAAARRVARGRAAILWLAAAAASSGCGGDDEATLRRTRTDIGTFCMRPNADGGIEFLVFVSPLDECLSTCHINTLSCRATRTGGRIDLTTRLEIRDNPDVEVCDAACHGTSGRCVLEDAPPGEYQFGFASRFDTATLPLALAAPLFGDHSCGAE